jgi:putative ABC transport system permease protein
MALGAQRTQVLKLIVRQGMFLVAIGLGVGLGAAFGAGTLIASLLFETQPFDTAIYAIVTVVFTMVALLACILPALRAAKIDPIMALRAE